MTKQFGYGRQLLPYVYGVAAGNNLGAASWLHSRYTRASERRNHGLNFVAIPQNAI